MSQTNNQKPDTFAAPHHEGPYTYVEQMPKFPGGEDKLFSYLSEHLKYPSFARENNITGTVFLSFVITDEEIGRASCRERV